jgi:hypothetical protein
MTEQPRDRPDDGAAGVGDRAEFSQHPADRLVRHLVLAGGQATPGEIAQIVERMATAPFNPSAVHVAVKHRGLACLGRVLGAREDALTYHLVQRVVVERQWAAGTTASQYLADLRRAIRGPQARVAVYARRGGVIAAILAETTGVVPVGRRTPDSLPQLLVVYAADGGIILSGYQISGLEATGVPKEARWLR